MSWGAGSGGFSFGQNQNNQNTNTGSSGGLFGQSSGGGLFGQNNQSTPGTSAFGGNAGSNAFGSTPTNTGGSLFGGQQNNNSSFGFGSSPASSSGGAFGQQNRPAFGSSNTGGGLFGSNTSQPQANSAFGGFGSTSSPAFGQSNQNNTGGGLFGQNKPSTPFGSGTGQSGGGLFGSGAGGGTPNTAAPSAFGSGGTSAFGSSPFGTNQQQQSGNGTAQPPWQVTTERDAQKGGNNNFQSITCMPAYQHFSFEELRSQDYNQGRRYGNSSGTGAFGQSTGFGGFGQQNNQQQGGGLFGQPAQNTQSGGSLFGGTQQNQGSPAFGSSFGSNTNQGGGGPFGSTTGNTGGAFGSQANQNSTSGGGLFGNRPTGFGQQQTTQPSGGLFGSSNTTSAFGQKPATGFGQQNTGFGSANSTPGSGGGLFGGGGFGANTNQNQTQTQTPPGGSLFGSQPSSTPSGQLQQSQPPNQGSGLFGGFGQQNQNQANQNQNQQNTGFSFGSSNNQQQQKPAFSFGGNQGTNTGGSGLFGGTSNQSQGGGGLFGSSSTNTGNQFGQQQNKPSFGFGGTNTSQGGGLFGQSNTGGTSGGSGGLFGQSNNQQNQFGGGGLFGGSSTNQQNTNNAPSGGLFGNTQNQGTSLFGNKPTQTGGFGSSQPAQPSSTGQTSSLFGGGSSLFGQNNQTPGSSLFGGTQPPQQQQQQQQQQPQPQMQQSQFQPQQQQQQQPLQASLDQSPYSTNPLFQSGYASNAQSPGPIASPLVTSAQKKKPASVPMFRLTPRSGSAPKFGYPSSRPGTPLEANSASSIGSTPNIARSLHLYNAFNDDVVLSPDAFTPRKGIKKLVIDKKSMEGTDILTGGADPAGETTGPPKDDGARVKKSQPQNAEQHPANIEKKFQVLKEIDGSTVTPSKPSNETAVQNGDYRSPAVNGVAPSNENDDGTYWTSPSLSILQDYTKEALRKVENFKVGRRGYGQVSFNQPVDLSGFDRLEDVPGQIVIFEPKVCTVYPNESKKPIVGQGMNVPATITLEKCWPLSKETREPILDPDHPRFQQHIKRLKKMSETEFIDFIADNGGWIFRVKHFSKYGLGEDDDEDEEAEQEDQRRSQAQRAANEARLEANESYRLKTGPTPRYRARAYVDSPQTDHRYQQTPGAFPLSDDFSESPKMEFAQPEPESMYIEDTFEYLPKRRNSDSAKKLRLSEELGRQPQAPTKHSPVESSFISDQASQTDSFEYINNVSDESIRSTAPAAEPALISDNESQPSVSSEEQFVPDDSRSELFQRSDSMAPVAKSWEQQLEMSMERGAYLSDSRLVQPHKAIRDLRAKESNRENLKKLSITPDSSEKNNPIFKPRFHSGLLITETSGTKVRMMDFSLGDSGEMSTTLLKVQMEQSEIVSDETGTPSAYPRPGLDGSLLCSHSKGQPKEIWKLAQILFDPIHLADEQDLSQEALRRIRESIRLDTLSDLLRNAVADSVDEHLSRVETPFDRILVLLSGNRVEEAAFEAVQSGNMKLASLITLIGGDEAVQSDLRSQSEQWHRTGDIEFMDPQYLAIWALLSGETSPALDDFKASLDWKRHLGLYLWYDRIDIRSISRSAKNFEEANHGHFQSGETLPDSLDSLMYKLILLKSSESAYLDEMCSDEHISLLLRWQIFVYLAYAQGIANFSDRTLYHDDESGEEITSTSMKADQLTLSLASELEAHGRYLEAIFVSLHMEHPISKLAEVQYLLGKYVNSQSYDDESLIRSVVGASLPRQWILEAKALSARSSSDYFEESKSLIEAGLLVEAHETFIHYVGPRAVISDKFGSAHTILQQLGTVSSIPQWSTGGQVYLDYINLASRGSETEIALQGAHTSQDLLSTLNRMARAITATRRNQLEQRVAITIISDFVSSTLLEIEGVGEGKWDLNDLPTSKGVRWRCLARLGAESLNEDARL